jgi:hypothetical protein
MKPQTKLKPIPPVIEGLAFLTTAEGGFLSDHSTIQVARQQAQRLTTIDRSLIVKVFAFTKQPAHQFSGWHLLGTWEKGYKQQ